METALCALAALYSSGSSPCHQQDVYCSFALPATTTGWVMSHALQVASCERGVSTGKAQGVRWSWVHEGRTAHVLYLRMM